MQIQLEVLVQQPLLNKIQTRAMALSQDFKASHHSYMALDDFFEVGEPPCLFCSQNPAVGLANGLRPATIAAGGQGQGFQPCLIMLEKTVKIPLETSSVFKIRVASLLSMATAGGIHA